MPLRDERRLTFEGRSTRDQPFTITIDSGEVIPCVASPCRDGSGRFFVSIQMGYRCQFVQRHTTWQGRVNVRWADDIELRLPYLEVGQDITFDWEGGSKIQPGALKDFNIT